MNQEGSVLNPVILGHDIHYKYGSSTARSHSLAQADQLEHIDVSGPASPVPSDGSAKDRDVDAMGCVDGWALRNGLLGTASGASFMRQIRKAAEGSEIPDPGGAKGSKSNHVSNPLLKLRRPRTDEGENTERMFVLPPKKTADHLFKTYWEIPTQSSPGLIKKKSVSNMQHCGQRPRIRKLTRKSFIAR